MALAHLDVVTADALDSAARSEIIELCEGAYGEVLRLPSCSATLVTTSLLTAEGRVGELW
jgi:hypothetical protein